MTLRRATCALPERGRGPGVIVVQEWWGLDSGIKEMADRLADGGFVAFAPDLYHGELAEHTEMDKAGELMNAMPPDRAARDMSGAVDLLADHTAVTSDGHRRRRLLHGRPVDVRAGRPATRQGQGRGAVLRLSVRRQQPDYSADRGPDPGPHGRARRLLHPEGAVTLEQRLRELGKDVTFTVHPGTGHAFMAPHNALGTHDQAAYDRIWPQVLAFLHQHLD